MLWMTAPPATKPSSVVTIVVLIVVLFLVLVPIIAAVLYVMSSGLISGGGSNPPTMTLGPSAPAAGGDGDDYDFHVVNVDTPLSISTLKVALTQNGTMVFAPVTLSSGNPVIGMGDFGSLHLSLIDVGGDGRLNSGDVFGLWNTEPGNTYRVLLLWAADASEIAEKVITV